MMNDLYDQDFNIGVDWTDVQLSESDHYTWVSELESTANEYGLIRTTKNAAPASEVRRPNTFGEAELTTGANNHFLGDVITKPIQQKAIPKVSQAAAQVDTGSENTDLKGKSASFTDDQASKLEKKRKNDRAYRQRQREAKRKDDEELEALRKENAALQKKLQKREQKVDGDHQQNAPEEYFKMEFHLDCDDDESRSEAMKIVGGVAGMKKVCLDIEENTLSLFGKDIDTLPLQSRLKKICNATLVSLLRGPKIDHEKKEGKIMVESDCMVVSRNSALVAQKSVPMSCSTPYSYPFTHIASAYPNGGHPEEWFDFNKAAIFFLMFLVFLLGLACCVLYFR